jgi:hypothetical protein
MLHFRKCQNQQRDSSSSSSALSSQLIPFSIPNIFPSLFPYSSTFKYHDVLSRPVLRLASTDVFLATSMLSLNTCHNLSSVAFSLLPPVNSTAASHLPTNSHVR